MPYLPKIVLHCLNGEPPGLDALVEAFLSDRVIFVGVVGKDASRIEDIIDEFVVGDGSDDTRTLLTSNHERETLDQAIEFARSLTGEFAGDVQVVEV
jgi:hypothetical protein